MPEFCNPFSVLKSDRKLTQEELVRAIRFMIAAEYEAIQLYQQTAESMDNKLAKEVLTDIANEEKEHAGYFRLWDIIHLLPGRYVKGFRLFFASGRVK